MTTKQVSAALQSENVRKNKGVFTFWKSYYWGLTKTPDKLVEIVRVVFPDCQIVDSGNHYHDFVGGAKSGSPKDSYLWVKFKFN